VETDSEKKRGRVRLFRVFYQSMDHINGMGCDKTIRQRRLIRVTHLVRQTVALFAGGGRIIEHRVSILVENCLQTPRVCHVLVDAVRPLADGRREGGQFFLRLRIRAPMSTINPNLHTHTHTHTSWKTLPIPIVRYPAFLKTCDESWIERASCGTSEGLGCHCRGCTRCMRVCQYAPWRATHVVGIDSVRLIPAEAL
jgi:hypothetical protein